MNNAPNQLSQKQPANLATAIAIIGCICFVATLYIYRPVGLYFLNDDLIHIPWSGKGVFIQQGFLRCVHNVLSFIEIKCFGQSPVGFHAVNLFMHLVCAYLVYVLSTIIFTKYSNAATRLNKPTAILAAAIFMVYAFHSESVLWIIGSVSAMSTMFFLLSFIFYFKKEKSIVYFLLSLILFVIALLTYENVWVMPALVCFFWYADVKRNGNYKGWIYPAVVAIVFLLHLYVRIKMLGQVASAYEAGNVSHFNITVLFLNFNRLVARSFLPPMQSVAVFMAFYGVVLLVIIVGVSVLIRKKKLDVLIVLLGLSLLFSYLPVVSLGIDTHGTGAERYLYLPSVFLCILVAYLITNCKTTWQRKTVLIAIIVCFNCFYALKSSADYHLASQLSEKVLAEAAINMLANKTYQVYGLPSTVNKVKVLDIGFKEGMAWLYQKDSSLIKEMDKVALVTKSKADIPIIVKAINSPIFNTENKLRILFDSSFFTIIPFVKKDD